MKSNLQNKKRELFTILQNCDTDRREIAQKVDIFISDLIKEKWTRKNVYDFICDAINNPLVSISEECEDALLDVDGGLIGDCAAECIIRFPGDPENPKELRDFVGNGLWKKE